MELCIQTYSLVTACVSCEWILGEIDACAKEIVRQYRKPMEGRAVFLYRRKNLLYCAIY